MEISLGFTKADQLGARGSTTVEMSDKIGSNSCPYKLLLAWYKMRINSGADKRDPLFCWDDGSPITPDQVSDMVKIVARVASMDIPVSGHSLRITGATQLALAGMPFDRIQALGRWKSMAHLLYIRDLSVNNERIDRWKQGISTCMGL
jgi:hypothetical protein